MERKVPISDAAISRNVTQYLAGRGLRSPCRIEVQTRNGEVTLSGTVQYVHQRDTAVQAIRTVEGIKRVVEKLKVTPPAKHQYPQTPGPLSKPPAVHATQGESGEAPTADAPDAPHKPNSSPDEPPASEQLSTAGESTDFSFSAGDAPPLTPRVTTPGMRHLRQGESYTFECADRDQAERLRVLLATYADWLKKNAWVGESKPNDGAHRVTFHAKSVIEFLRQQGF